LALYNYASNRTGLLLVDPYNDLLSDGGKLWLQAKTVADAVNLLTICAHSSRRHAARVLWCSMFRTGDGVRAILMDGVILALGRP
jgi:hypothetical protein